MEKKNKKQQPPEYTVTARVRGKRERFAMLFPCCLDHATEKLPELEGDPQYNTYLCDFRIARHDYKLRMWNPPHVYR